MTEAFVFYRSFYEALKTFDNDTIAEYIKLISEYALNDDLVVSENAVANALFLMSKPQVDANKKRRENGAKGGAPKGNNNASKTTEKQPKNNQKQPKDKEKDNILSPTNVVDNNIIKKTEEKINFSSSKKDDEKVDFYSHFRELALPIWKGKECEIWRELMAKKYGILDWGQAIIDFKNHIIEHGNESKVMQFSKCDELKSYMANALRIKNRDNNNFLSEKAKQKPKQTYYSFAQEQDVERWRKPCQRLQNREVEAYGKKILVGVILQDGKELYCSPDMGHPESRYHYYDPFKERYEDTRKQSAGQTVDIIPQGILALPIDYYLKEHSEEYKPLKSDF